MQPFTCCHVHAAIRSCGLYSFALLCYTYVKVHCYLATRPEIEGFRDLGFVLPEVESLRVQSFVAS